MESPPIQEITETENLVYWRDRVASLEGLVSELLIKNQHMRFVLQETTQERPETAALA
jgi:hypothetical protein